MPVSEGSREKEASVASESAPEKKEKAEKAELSYKELAARNVARARRSLPDEEGDKTATAEHLMQSAIVFAILELADAVRSNPKP
jgi:hypothetical protein